MTSDAPHPWRIGCVRYLNSRPLIAGHEQDILLEHPSALARDLHAGLLDAALVPVFEIFAHPGYLLVDGCGIVSRGAVHSVILAHTGDLARLEEVALDPASLSSAHLIRILLAERFGLHPRYRPLVAGEEPAAGKGVLLIGDQAFEGLHRWGERYAYYDLGQGWWDATGLPFVFACWAIRPEAPEPSALAERLRGWMREGFDRIESIVAEQPADFREEAERYLRHHIFYEMRECERRGLQLFGRKLVEHQLVKPEAEKLTFL